MLLRILLVTTISCALTSSLYDQESQLYQDALTDDQVHPIRDAAAATSPIEANSGSELTKAKLKMSAAAKAVEGALSIQGALPPADDSESELAAAKVKMGAAEEEVQQALSTLPPASNKPVPEMEEAEWFHMHGSFFNNPNLKGYPCFNRFPCYLLSKVSWRERKFRAYMLRDAIGPAMTNAISSTVVCPSGSRAVYKHLRFDSAHAYRAYQNLVKVGFNAYNPETFKGNCGWPPAGKGPVPSPGPNWKRMPFVTARCNLLTSSGQPLPSCKRNYRHQRCYGWRSRSYCGWPHGTYSRAQHCWLSAWIAGGAKFEIADQRSSRYAFNHAARSRNCRKCHKGHGCVV